MFPPKRNYFPLFFILVPLHAHLSPQVHHSVYVCVSTRTWKMPVHVWFRHCPQADFFLDFSQILEFKLQNNVRQTLPNQKLRSGSEPTLTSTFFGLLIFWVFTDGQNAALSHSQPWRPPRTHDTLSGFRPHRILYPSDHYQIKATDIR